MIAVQEPASGKCRMKRAVLYARVSTDAQQKDGTIESQVLELKRQIAAAGDVLVKEYVDDGYSGTLLDRPGLEALRRDVRTPLFDAVYFLDTDRIARDLAYQTIIHGELIKHGKAAKHTSQRWAVSGAPKRDTAETVPDQTFGRISATL